MIFIRNDGTNYVYSSRGNLQPTKLTTGRTAGDWQWLDVLKCTQRSSRLLYMVKKGGLCLMEAKTTWHRTRVGWVGSITAWDSDFVHLSASPLTRDDRHRKLYVLWCSVRQQGHIYLPILRNNGQRIVMATLSKQIMSWLPQDIQLVIKFFFFKRYIARCMSRIFYFLCYIWLFWIFFFKGLPF